MRVPDWERERESDLSHRERKKAKNSSEEKESEKKKLGEGGSQGRVVRERRERESLTNQDSALRRLVGGLD